MAAHRSGRVGSPAGRWVAFELPPYAVQGVHCHACGAMIPRRYWTLAQGDGPRYCGPACEELERRVEELGRRYPEATRPAATREP
jgi:hypothetical protein